MKSTSDLFGEYKIPEKNRKTQRGELLRFISEQTGYNIKHVAFRVTGFSVRDLEFLKSDMTQANARGIGWGRAFNAALK